MGIVFVLVLVGFVGFVLWRKSQNKKSPSDGSDNYTPPDNQDVDQNPGTAGKPDIDVGDTVKPAKE